MMNCKIRTSFKKIEKAFGRGELSSHARALLFKDGEALCTPDTGVKISFLGGGWFHIGGYSWDGTDVEQTLEHIYGA